jgi:beta-lactamase class A
VKQATLMIATLLLLSSCASKSLEAGSNSISYELAKLEASTGGRIGLSAVNTKTGEHFEYRSDERFPFCSTFKSIVVAAILEKAGEEPDLLNRRILFNRREVERAGYAPVTLDQYKQGMSVSELCAAAIQKSDNGAANLLIKIVGGVGAINEFSRRNGDHDFRLDRMEPNLNSALPNDQRDTTTPAAMETSLQQFLVGEKLPAEQRQQFREWLESSVTGNKRIRAGVRKLWKVGDKTGTCSYGTTNDVGILSSVINGPVVIAIFFTQKERNAKPRDDVIASAATLVDERLRIRKP